TIEDLRAKTEPLNIEIYFNAITEENKAALSRLIHEKAQEVLINFRTRPTKVAANFLNNLFVRAEAQISVYFDDEVYAKPFINFLKNNRDISVIKLQLRLESAENPLLQRIADELTKCRFVDLIGGTSELSTWDKRANENAIKLQQLLKERGRDTRIINEIDSQTFVDGKWIRLTEEEKQAIKNARDSAMQAEQIRKGMAALQLGVGEKFVAEFKKREEVAKEWQKRFNEVAQNTDVTARLKLIDVLFGKLTEEIITFLTKEDCEKAVKNRIIHQENFFFLSIGNNEPKLVTAANEILIQMAKTSQTSTQLLKVARRQLDANPSATLRILVMDPLFTDVEFVRSIKPQLRVFHERYKADYEDKGKPQGHPYLRI
ncbi:MAG: FKBP-type peptidyl-prolyl cis-trans isomerase N-terminal domain-containing protein, partial [Alphaproteobacteria bacterium]|nr:FKBP-type peptidyl-prolyl cis-trans isomerase N-terminal domain-containing protein [Alphaproteobacteria bacterium]